MKKTKNEKIKKQTKHEEKKKRKTKKTKPWTLKVALRPSGVFLVVQCSYSACCFWQRTRRESSRDVRLQYASKKTKTNGEHWKTKTKIWKNEKNKKNPTQKKNSRKSNEKWKKQTNEKKKSKEENKEKEACMRVDPQTAEKSFFFFEVPAGWIVVQCSYSACCFRQRKRSESSRDVLHGLFLSQKKMHRSVTTKILVPDMFLRCDTKKKTKELTQFDGSRFCTTRRKKGTALHDGVGSSMVCSSDSRASKCHYSCWSCQKKKKLQRMAIDSPASVWIRRWCVFVCSTLLYFRVFFFCMSAHAPFRFFFFAKFVAGFGNEMPRKRKNSVTKWWGQLEKKRWGRRKVNFTNSKTLVGVATDRNSRYLRRPRMSRTLTKQRKRTKKNKKTENEKKRGKKKRGKIF